MSTFAINLGPSAPSRHTFVPPTSALPSASTSTFAIHPAPPILSAPAPQSAFMSTFAINPVPSVSAGPSRLASAPPVPAPAPIHPPPLAAPASIVTFPINTALTVNPSPPATPPPYPYPQNYPEDPIPVSFIFSSEKILFILNIK
jgi:hypothetical protein